VQLYDATTYEAKIQANWLVAVTTSTTLTISTGTQVPSLANGTYRMITLDYDKDEGALFGNFQPASLLYANNTLYQGDGRGFCFTYDSSETADVIPVMNISSPLSTGDNGTAGAQVYHAGPFLDLGTTEYRKWVNSVVFKLRPRVDISTTCAFTPYSENDDNNSPLALKDIFRETFYRWGTLTYGDPLLWRRRQKIIDEKRRSPLVSSAANTSQVQLRNAFVNLYNSDTYGTGSVSAGSGATPGFIELGIAVLSSRWGTGSTLIPTITRTGTTSTRL
jgi:hypothetical protein